MRNIEYCTECSRPLILESELLIGDTLIKTFKCGHFTTLKKEMVNEDSLDFKAASDDTKFARNYQQTGVRFIIESGFNCVIGDQMRLGKTPQALLALKNRFKERTPCLIIVRSANLWQWVREFKTWTNNDPMGVFVIEGSKNWIPPGFSSYIISMDSLARGNNLKKLKEFGFKLVIADEAHSFKNTDSKRSKAFIQFLKEMNHANITHVIPFTCTICKEQWEETITVSNDSQRQRMAKWSNCPSCGAEIYTQANRVKTKEDRKCGAVMLTGTPIKNRADEYFVPLNIVAPDKFPSLERYKREWLIPNSRGQYSKVHPYKMDDFKELIKPYVLRREKEDVFTDLPVINRMFTVIQIEDESIKKAYNSILDRMEKQEAERSNYTFFDSIGDLMILRQLCGMAKVPYVADLLDLEIHEGESKEKYAIGIHHHMVRDSLANRFGVENVLRLSGEDSAQRKDQIMREFETSKQQILVVNMLAGGVGMDFHYCHNVFILERQWSSADEEQFEFRFYNPDRSIMGDNQLNVEYIIAQGTIDEWFYDLVEEKRRIFGETVGTNWSLESDEASFKTLLEKTIANRL